MKIEPTPATRSAHNQSTPAVICVAPNGARRTKRDHPALPMTEREIVDEARACAEAGASVIHLHVRDEHGGHSLDTARYRSVTDAIHETLGERLLVQVTTESVGIYLPEQQRQLLRELRPRAASVAIRELIPDDSHAQETARLFAWAGDAGVALQYIVYTAAEARRIVELARAGVICDERPNTLFVLGRYTPGQQSSPADLLPFLEDWPRDWPWTVCAFGQAEAMCMAAAVALGGHVRVGFENNLTLPNGELASRSADLVANIAHIVARSGRLVASAAQAKALYNVA